MNRRNFLQTIAATLAAFVLPKPTPAEPEITIEDCEFRDLEDEDDFEIEFSEEKTEIGKTYYVRCGANGSNQGTLTIPFATIGQAMQVAKAGDTIYIRGGY